MNGKRKNKTVIHVFVKDKTMCSVNDRDPTIANGRRAQASNARINN